LDFHILTGILLKRSQNQINLHNILIFATPTYMNIARQNSLVCQFIFRCSSILLLDYDILVRQINEDVGYKFISKLWFH